MTQVPRSEHPFYRVTTEAVDSVNRPPRRDQCFEGLQIGTARSMRRTICAEGRRMNRRMRTAVTDAEGSCLMNAPRTPFLRPVASPVRLLVVKPPPLRGKRVLDDMRFEVPLMPTRILTQ